MSGSLRSFAICWLGAILLLRPALVAAGDGDASSPVATRSAPAPGPHGTVLDRTNALVLLGLGSAAWVSHATRNGDELAGDLDRNALDLAYDVATVYGEGYTLSAAALGLMAYGHHAGDANLSQAGRELVFSLAAAWAVTWTLKYSINEERPNGGSYSFPSGHTATAFAGVPVLWRRFGPEVGAPAAGMATLTAVARIADRKHWLADVLAGAAIGIVAGRSLSTPGAKGAGSGSRAAAGGRDTVTSAAREERGGLRLEPAAPGGVPGLGLSFRF